MLHRFGFFDTDCRDYNRKLGALDYRPRVLPLAPRLEILYSLIEKNQYPFVFSTCCSGSMPLANDLPDVLYIPLDASDQSWTQKIDDYRRFYLAKKAYGDPKRNAECRAFDMFQDNQNAPKLIQSLNVDTWIVFGNGFDLCVNAAAQGLLKCGVDLIVLSDVRISSAGGTPDSELLTMNSLIKSGAKTMLLDNLLALNT